MAGATGIGGWVVRNWKRGWNEIPLLMCSHIITGPLMIGCIGIYLFTDWVPKAPVEKYRSTYTVMRSDDPRVPRINHYSSIDKLGPLS